MSGERRHVLKKMFVGFIGIILNNECRFQEPDSLACVVHQYSTCLDHWYLNWVPHCKNTKVEVVLRKYGLNLLALQDTPALCCLFKALRELQKRSIEVNLQHGYTAMWNHISWDSGSLQVLPPSPSPGPPTSSRLFLFWCCWDRPRHLWELLPWVVFSVAKTAAGDTSYVPGSPSFNSYSGLGLKFVSLLFFFLFFSPAKGKQVQQHFCLFLECPSSFSLRKRPFLMLYQRKLVC